MRDNATSRGRKIGSVVAGLAVLLFITVANQQTSAWSRIEKSKADMDALAMSTAESSEITHNLIIDLMTGRIRLASAIELFIQANAERFGVLQMVLIAYPAPTFDESIALNLLSQVDSQPRAQKEMINGLDREYLALFHHRPDYSSLLSRQADPTVRTKAAVR